MIGGAKPIRTLIVAATVISSLAAPANPQGFARVVRCQRTLSRSLGSH
jgi:hypothetical protein